MKTRLFVLMMAASFIIGGNTASAQLGSFLKDKATEALNKKPKKTDSAEPKKKETDQSQQQPQQNPAGNLLQKRMMGMMGMKDVKHETVYSFTSSMSMEMQSTDSLGKKSDKVLYTTFFDKNSKSFAMEFVGVDKQSGQKQNSLMIFDYKNWAMLILADKGTDKSGIAMEMAKDSVIEAQQNGPTKESPQVKQDISNYNMYYKPTGKTKTISGYNCKEYVYDNPEGKGEIWATNDVAFDYSSAYGHMGGMQALATGGTTYGLGMVMEMHFSDKHTKATSDMIVTDIKPSNPKSLNIAGYQIIGMGGPQGQQPKGKSKK